MRSRTLLLALFLYAFSGSAAFGQNQYGWSLSESDIDPCVTTGSPTFGVKNLYLWHTYNFADPMSAADLSLQGSLAPLAFTTANGFLNAGDATNLLLAVGGCPPAPVAAGFVLIIDTGGNLAIAGARLTVDCVVNNPYVSGTTGWSSDGSAPVEFEVQGSTGCRILVDYVEPRSWGNVKHLYR